MASVGFVELKVYQLAEKLADEVWGIVRKWDLFAKDTVGKQLVRAVDSIGANIAEGTGRGSFKTIGASSKWPVGPCMRPGIG